MAEVRGNYTIAWVCKKGVIVKVRFFFGISSGYLNVRNVVLAAKKKTTYVKHTVLRNRSPPEP